MNNGWLFGWKNEGPKAGESYNQRAKREKLSMKNSNKTSLWKWMWNNDVPRIIAKCITSRPAHWDMKREVHQSTQEITPDGNLYPNEEVKNNGNDKHMNRRPINHSTCLLTRLDLWLLQPLLEGANVTQEYNPETQGRQWPLEHTPTKANARKKEARK